MQAYISKPDAEGSPWLSTNGGELAPASDAIRQVVKLGSPWASCDPAAATADVPTGVFCSAEHLCLLVDPSLL